MYRNAERTLSFCTAERFWVRLKPNLTQDKLYCFTSEKTGRAAPSSPESSARSRGWEAWLKKLAALTRWLSELFGRFVSGQFCQKKKKTSWQGSEIKTNSNDCLLFVLGHLGLQPLVLNNGLLLNTQLSPHGALDLSRQWLLYVHR